MGHERSESIFKVKIRPWLLNVQHRKMTLGVNVQWVKIKCYTWYQCLTTVYRSMTCPLYLTKDEFSEMLVCRENDLLLEQNVPNRGLRGWMFTNKLQTIRYRPLYGPRQANLVLIAYASSEGSGEPAHPRSLVRTSAARSYKQWVKRNLQTES